MFKFCVYFPQAKSKQVTIEYGKGITEVMCNGMRTLKEKTLTVPAGRGFRDYIKSEP